MSFRSKVAALTAMAALGLDTALGKIGRGKRRRANQALEDVVDVQPGAHVSRAVTLEPEITPSLGEKYIQRLNLLGRHNRKRRRSIRGRRHDHPNFNRRSMLSAPQPQE